MKEQKKQERMDESKRNAVEGKFGEGKRAYGMGLIMAKTEETSKTEIMLGLLNLNLEKLLRATSYFQKIMGIYIFPVHLRKRK